MRAKLPPLALHGMTYELKADSAEWAMISTSPLRRVLLMVQVVSAALTRSSIFPGGSGSLIVTVAESVLRREGSSTALVATTSTATRSSGGSCSYPAAIFTLIAMQAASDEACNSNGEKPGAEGDNATSRLALRKFSMESLVWDA
jgi:hypothetical protein